MLQKLNDRDSNLNSIHRLLQLTNKANLLLVLVTSNEAHFEWYGKVNKQNCLP